MKFRYVAVIFAVIAVLIGAGTTVFLLQPRGEQRALVGAPGLDLIYPNGTPIELDDSNPVLGAHAYQVRGYGTDNDKDEILGFFDAALDELGYQQTPPTRDMTPRFQQYKPLRQYHDGTFTYRLYLLDVPYRLSRNVTVTGYRHVLFTQLSS